MLGFTIIGVIGVIIARIMGATSMDIFIFVAISFFAVLGILLTE